MLIRFNCRAGLFVTVLAALVFATPVSAQTITLKIASIAPEKSPYGDALNKLAKEWSRITKGKVKLVMFFSGVAGEEFDIVRKMRLGQLQGAMLSQMGLSFIDRRTNILTAPYLLRDNDELDYVLQGMIPEFDKMLTDKNFVPVAYSRAGWLRFFSKSELIRTPAQMSVRKLGVSGTEKDFFEGFKKMKFNVVPVEVSESLSALNTGLCDSTFSSPLLVGPLQWFGIANHMLDLKISPFIGAIVIDEKAWNKVPEEYRAEMLKVAKELASKEMNSAIDKLENEAIETMVKYGLIRVVPTTEELKLWDAEMAKALPLMAESAFDKATLDKARAILKTFPGTKK